MLCITVWHDAIQQHGCIMHDIVAVYMRDEVPHENMSCDPIGLWTTYVIPRNA